MRCVKILKNKFESKPQQSMETGESAKGCVKILKNKFESKPQLLGIKRADFAWCVKILKNKFESKPQQQQPVQDHFQDV